MTVRVVGAAIVRGGFVLAARRVGSEAGWEFPGGKVEPGESDEDALVREIDEELGVPVTIGACLGEVADDRIRLVLYPATIIAGEPTARHDHDVLRWLAAGELGDVDWLPIDRRLLDLVREELR